jgi:hypothetical protein
MKQKRYYIGPMVGRLEGISAAGSPPKEGQEVMSRLLTTRVGLCVAVGGLALVAGLRRADAGFTGAIYTTNSTCDGTNINIFAAHADVYLDGGPVGGGSGLPDGDYYVQVTTPSGDLLGTTIGSGNDTPVHVTSGNFDECYRLDDFLIKASDSSPGFDESGNGEYKVWVSPDSEFHSQKTDNFQVDAEATGGGDPVPEFCVAKFYDANANGVWDDGEVEITGWQVIVDDLTDDPWSTPECRFLEPGTHEAVESPSSIGNWQATTSTAQTGEVVEGGEPVSIQFGNLCLGPGGGLTLGFWSNKNGQNKMGDAPNGATPELTMLTNLCLRDGAGNDVSFANYAAFRSWLLSATATNMAYMLSAQLAAMELNVEGGFVSGSSLVYAPGCGNTGVGNNYITISDLMTAAASSLCSNGLTKTAGTARTCQECLKNALDKANNNLNFVQTQPCEFSFE